MVVLPHSSFTIHTALLPASGVAVNVTVELRSTHCSAGESTVPPFADTESNTLHCTLPSLTR